MKFHFKKQFISGVGSVAFIDMAWDDRSWFFCEVCGLGQEKRPFHSLLLETRLFVLKPSCWCAHFTPGWLVPWKLVFNWSWRRAHQLCSPYTHSLSLTLPFQWLNKYNWFYMVSSSYCCGGAMRMLDNKSELEFGNMKTGNAPQHPIHATFIQQ